MLKTVSVFLLVSMCFADGANAETLNLLIWEKYISPDLIKKWTAQTGVDVRQIYFDNGDNRDKLLADPDSDIDLSIMNENITRLFSRKNKLLAVSSETVPSIKNLVPRWRDRCFGYGLPYFWGTLGIVYRTDKIHTPPTSWKDILAPAKELSGHIAMMHSSDDLLTPPLILADKSVSTGSQADLKLAFDILKAQKPYVKTYNYILTSAQDKKYGDDLFMALAYSGDQFSLKGVSQASWRYVVPKEGTVIWVDCLTINATSKRKNLAIRFLNFINDPANSAENAIYLSQPTPNMAAMALLPETMKQDTEIFPPKEIIAASQFYEEYSAQIVQLRKRIANSVSSFHDTQ